MSKLICAVENPGGTRMELRVHLEGEHAEWWSIVAIKDAVRSGIAVGQKAYVQKKWCRARLIDLSV